MLRGTIGLLAILLVSAGSAEAKGGSCVLSDAKDNLLAVSGNGVVEKLRSDLGTLRGRLGTLESTNTFYPGPCGEPNSPACITRKKLVDRFHDAVVTETAAFEDFLSDVVSARDKDCENCRWVTSWQTLNGAGYPNVTPDQLITVSKPNLAAATAFETAMNACTDDGCRDTLGVQIRSVLAPIPDNYGDQGFPGGKEFAQRMLDTLANLKKACPAS